MLKLTTLYSAISICILASSCSNEQKDNTQLFTAKIKQEISDQAFKNNVQVDILDFKFIKYETIDENKYDTVKLIHYQDMMQAALKDMKVYSKKISLEKEKQELYNEIDSDGSLGSSSGRDIEELKEKLRAIGDTAQQYIKKDSLLEIEISNRKSPKLVYKAKVFLKAVSTYKGEKNNFMDTAYYYFDEKMNLKRLQ